MPSLTEENYLKAIYVLNQSSDSSASTNAIAERLETKASSVSDMLKRLKQKNLIHYKKYQAVSLTEEGKKIAISIIRKHRLWEFFLVENLKFGWDEVHELAEQLEHIQSTELTDRLNEYLGCPELDPHGDPIPDKDGNFPTRTDYMLSDCKASTNVVVVGVKDHSTEFLNYLNQLNVELGTKIQVLNIHAFDCSMDIQIDNTKIQISNKVAENLYVK